MESKERDPGTRCQRLALSHRYGFKLRFTLKQLTLCSTWLRSQSRSWAWSNYTRATTFNSGQLCLKYVGLQQSKKRAINLVNFGSKHVKLSFIWRGFSSPINNICHSSLGIFLLKKFLFNRSKAMTCFQWQFRHLSFSKNKIWQTLYIRGWLHINSSQLAKMKKSILHMSLP